MNPLMPLEESLERSAFMNLGIVEDQQDEGLGEELV
jgi:hypothetical protein